MKRIGGWALLGLVVLGPVEALAGELFGQTNSDPAAKRDPLEWFLGFIYTVKNGVALDAGFGTGLTNASPDLRLTGGVTWTF